MVFFKINFKHPKIIKILMNMNVGAEYALFIANG